MWERGMECGARDGVWVGVPAFGAKPGQMWVAWDRGLCGPVLGVNVVAAVIECVGLLPMPQCWRDLCVQFG